MADNEINHKGRATGAIEEDPAEPEGLRAEIRFWQDMIDTRSGYLPPEAVERMRYAKALAETRLMRYRGHTGPPCENVFQLDRARRKCI